MDNLCVFLFVGCLIWVYSKFKCHIPWYQEFDLLWPFEGDSGKQWRKHHVGNKMIHRPLGMVFIDVFLIRHLGDGLGMVGHMMATWLSQVAGVRPETGGWECLTAPTCWWIAWSIDLEMFFVFCWIFSIGSNVWSCILCIKSWVAGVGQNDLGDHRFKSIVVFMFFSY